MPVEERFTIRPFREGDERAILDLFARSFHNQRPLENWRWKYERNPWGTRRISLAFDEREALVGHYAAYPVPFADGMTDLIGQQVGDTMTDSAVRHIGRGPSSILGRTALHFYETFCSNGVAFNYGFNVANIQRFSLRFLRSDRVEPVRYLRIDAKSLRPISRWERRFRGYQLERLEKTSSEYDALFARVRGAYGLLVRRDAEYLRWRYLECPESPYVVVAIRHWRRLAGWMVYRIRDDRFTWGDALFDPAHIGAVAVALRHLVSGHPVRFVEGWFPQRPRWFSDQLQRLGFEESPEPQDLSLMCVPFAMMDATERMRQRFYYTWGDSDLF